MDKLSKFPYSVWLLRVLYFSYYYHKTSIAVYPVPRYFFHGKYRGRNFEYRPSLLWRLHIYVLFKNKRKLRFVPKRSQQYLYRTFTNLNTSLWYLASNHFVHNVFTLRYFRLTQLLLVLLRMSMTIKYADAFSLLVPENSDVSAASEMAHISWSERNKRKNILVKCKESASKRLNLVLTVLNCLVYIVIIFCVVMDMSNKLQETATSDVTCCNNCITMS